MPPWRPLLVVPSLTLVLLSSLPSLACQRDCVVECVTFESPPFLFVNRSLPPADQRRYSGVMVDLLSELFPRLSRNLTFRIHESPDPSVGRLLLNHSWTGLIGELVSSRADVALLPLHATPQAFSAVRFTSPLDDCRLRVVVKTSFTQLTSTTLWSVLSAFLQPFTMGLWGVCLLVCVVVGVLAWIIDWLSPYGVSAYRLDDDLATVGNAVGMTLAAFPSAGGTLGKAWSTRILLLSFMWFAMAAVATYTANFTVFLSGSLAPLTSVDYAQDLAVPGIPFAVVRGGAAENYFTDLSGPLSSMYKKNMRVVGTGEEALQMLMNRTVYSVVSEGGAAKYLAGRSPCRFGLISEYFAHSYSALAVRKDLDELADALSLSLLRMRREGALDRIQSGWTQVSPDCPPEFNVETSEERAPERLGLKHYSGIFLLVFVAALGSMLCIMWQLAKQRGKALADQRAREKHARETEERLRAQEESQQAPVLESQGGDGATASSTTSRRVVTTAVAVPADAQAVDFPLRHSIQ